MIVYYRLAGLKSTISQLPPIYENDILSLTKVCLLSFVKAFEKVKPKMVFIADYCGNEYENLVKNIVPFEYKYRDTALGINQTCLLQYQLFEDSKEDKVLFQEYDYLWLPNTGWEIPYAVEKFDFITPYDHPDKYEKEPVSEVKMSKGRYWKKTSSTTATFATKRKNFLKYKDIFYKYGYIDQERWLMIEKEEGELRSPLPSIATHMVAKYMSPFVDWYSLLKT